MRLLRLWHRYGRRMDVFKVKRLFTLKPALLMVSFVLVFQLGKMFSLSACVQQSSKGTDSLGDGMDKVMAQRQVKAQFQDVHDTENTLAAVEETFVNVNNLDKIDNNDALNKKGNSVYKKEETGKISSGKTNQNKSPKQQQRQLQNAVADKVANFSEKLVNFPKLVGKQPSLVAPAPQNKVFTDYYSTGSAAHHAGLKIMGWESKTKHVFKSNFINDPHIYSQETIIKAPGNRKKKLIACFNCPKRFYMSHKYNNDFKRCPYSECELSTGSGMNEKADMLIFWQDPESEPPVKPPGQLWTFMSWETPPNRAYPKNIERWKNLFNYTISYLSDADFTLPYDSMVWRDSSLLKPDQYYVDAAKSKTRTAAWWVSHCSTRSRRMAYVDEMKKYIKDLDVYGSCGNMTCPANHNDECWQRLNTTYRFYLSFENSFCPEYVTEKYFKLFRHRFNIIPVVRGGFDYEKHFLKGTFINTANFANAKELSRYLIALSKDPVKLGGMYKTKDRLGILNRKIDWCDFCQKMHTGWFKKRVISNVKEYSFSRPCLTAPNDIK